MRLRIGCAVFILGLLSVGAASAQMRTIKDAAGRQVEISADIKRIVPAGPPASIALYMVAPEALAGWVRRPTAKEKTYLAEPYASLPELGRLTGRGNTANLESILTLKPDLILDVGSVDATYASLADRTQQQTGIPYLLIDGSFAKTADTLRQLGRVTGQQVRAEDLARYAEATIQEVSDRIAKVPVAQRPRVYYGRGANGLETGLGGSINLEVLGFVGAENVAAAAGSGTLATVSVEQVLAWNPDVILTLDPTFAKAVLSDSSWSSVKAVRERRIYRAPTLPFGWFDAPPGINRLIGVRWLAKVLYPNLFPEDLRGVTRDFYQRFYHVALSDEQLNELLDGETTPP